MPVASRHPRLYLPEVDIFSLLFNRTERRFRRDKVLFQDADDLSRHYTYDEIFRLSLLFGQRLIREFGLRKGDRVAIVTPNDIDYPAVVFGILWAGCVVSPANPGYTVSELAYQLRDSGSTLVIAHYAALDHVVQACTQAGLSHDNILTLGQGVANNYNIQHWKLMLPCNGDVEASSSIVFHPKDDLAFLVYSSGTTGRPKGVMLTHYNITSNVLQISACEAGKLSSIGSRRVAGIPDAPPSGDKLLACLPLFHIYGLTSLVLAPIYNGVHTVVLARFEIVKFCRLIQDCKITFIYIVPPMALLLAKHPGVHDFDLSSIRMTNSGAAPLTKEVQQAVFQRTGIRIKQGYGLSETSPTTHDQRWEDWNLCPGSIGWLQPNMEAKFCEVTAEDASPETIAASREIPLGETGELYLRGPNVFKGYWKNAEATATSLSADQWFRTGDIGHVNLNGDFFITDRVKELIKYKGFQVPPAELEGHLFEHELVDDVVVVGVNSRVLGTEVPRAYVVRKGGRSAVLPGDDKLIMDWLATRVANHKKLRGGLKFVDTVPKSPSGKLLRRLIRDEARKEFTAMEDSGTTAKL